MTAVSMRCGLWMASVCAAVSLLAVPARAADVDVNGGAVYTSGQPVVITLDQAKVLKLPERTATLVVGNPLIADVSVQAGGIMVVTGKGYGTTNLVALDRTGVVLMEHPLEVQGPRENVVVLYRGGERESYSCTPKCERRITLGDNQLYFGGLLNQSNTLSMTAQQQGAMQR